MAKKIKCPIWLDEEAIIEWKRIVKLLEKENKDFTPKDVKALEGYCANYSKWKKCEQVLLKKGFSMIVNDEGYEQQRPEVSIANKAQQEMRSWMKELGITPAARSRMMKSSPQNSDGQYDEEMDDMISHG
ncbi:phage terminase small subunit P27 family [Clostridium tertium]